MAETLPRTYGDRSVLSRSTRVDRTTQLLSQLSRGDGDVAAIQDELIRINMVVAREVAGRYRGRGLSADDLEQVAYVGLCKAVRNYDAGKATDFLSYAVPTIRGELQQWFRDAGWVVRPPRSVQELQARVTAAQDEFAHTLGRPASPDEIAASLEVALAAVQDALAANGCFIPTSLDRPFDNGSDEDRHLADRLGDADPGYARAEARVALKPLMSGLTRRERRMLEMRFFHGATQAEIGAEIGVTQMQVSRLLSALLARLRDQMAGRSPHAAA